MRTERRSRRLVAAALGIALVSALRLGGDSGPVVGLSLLLAGGAAVGQRLTAARGRPTVAGAPMASSEGALVARRVHDALARLDRQGGLVAVLHGRIDQFEAVRDERGFVLADALVGRAVCRFDDVLRPGDTLTREGRAEFVVCCEGLTAEHEALAVAHALHEAMATPFADPFGAVELTASIGVSIASSPLDAADDLLRDASTAMLWGRSRQGGLTTFHRAALQARAERGLAALVDEPLVPVSVQLPLLRLTSSEIYGIRPGRTLVLSQRPDDPFDVLVGGARTFEGRLDRRGDRMSCVLTLASDRVHQ